MTVKTRTDLKDTMDTELADNVGGDISAQDVRENMKDSADSAVFSEDIVSPIRLGMTGIIDPVNDLRLSVNAGDNSKFDINAGPAVFSDTFTDPISLPVETLLNFSGATAITITDLATTAATFISLNAAGDIIQTLQLQREEDLRDNVTLGFLSHPDNATITAVANLATVGINSPAMAFVDLAFCQGAINCPTLGVNFVTGNSGTLGLNKDDGQWFLASISSRTNVKNPNMLDSAALNMPSMFIAWNTSDNVNGKTIQQNTVPAGVYDDGTAVFADPLPQGTLSTNNWVNHRVFMILSLNAMAVQIGQTTYSTAANAQAGILSETFSVIPSLSAITPLATLTMRGGATDLSMLSDANIRQAIPPRATFQ